MTGLTISDRTKLDQPVEELPIMDGIAWPVSPQTLSMHAISNYADKDLNPIAQCSFYIGIQGTFYTLYAHLRTL